MASLSRWLLPLATFTCVALVCATPTYAHVDELAGHLSDAATGVPIADATIAVLGTDRKTTTDEDGAFSFELPKGTYELQIEAQVGEELYRWRLVNQHVPQYRPSEARVYTDYFLEQGHPALEHAPGLPSSSGSLPEDAPGDLDLSESFNGSADPTRLTIPGATPTVIRVGRRQDHTGGQGCTDASNPVVAIDEMHLDEYVKGVLPPEIGVFRSIPGASEVYKTFAVAAKSYALYFMLYYDAGNRRTLGRSVPPHGHSWFHIDDTACNQRYSDERLTITTQAAEAVQNKVLVDRADANSLGKYEYAASCGRHGTRPEHQHAIVADEPPVSSCAGSWCGHNNCAGHEDHPNVSGGDRCLVRGICQWGSASWGEAGKSYSWMLDHYQPNLQVREFAAGGSETVVLTGYVYTDADDVAGSGLSAAQVELSDGQSTTTDDSGQYRFDAVELSVGTVDITASKSGYHSNTRSKELEAGVTNWGSVALSADGSDPADAGLSADDAGGARTDAGAESPARRASYLGPLVQRSQGVNRGCSATAGPPPSIAAIVWMLAAGFLLLRPRRRPS